jgi:Pumilio-family RNA binding repeat
VFDEVYDRFIELSMNNHGLCVVKLLISKMHDPKNREKLMTKIVKHAIELAQNPYGNYAIQQCFDFWEAEQCQDVIPQFFGKIYQLSMQKCSSNVIDKCIQKANPDYLLKILDELIKCDRLQSRSLSFLIFQLDLIMNQYGNFVV